MNLFIVSVRQHADICLFSTAQYKCPVATLDCEDGFPVGPSCNLSKVYSLTPLLSNNKVSCVYSVSLLTFDLLLYSHHCTISLLYYCFLTSLLYCCCCTIVVIVLSLQYCSYYTIVTVASMSSGPNKLAGKL